MAPLGILVIVASAIRISGWRAWLSIIGYAQESMVRVEQDLLSSTSPEVCEIWEGRQAEKIGKVVRLPKQRKVKVFFYDPVYKRVFDFRFAVNEGMLKRPAGFEEDVDMLPPNLVLNVGGSLAGVVETYVFAALAVLLQVAVLVVDAIVTYRFHLVTSGSRHIGFPLTCSGTILLCCGIFACSYVVENATEKGQYVPSSNGAGKTSEGGMASARHNQGEQQ